MTYQIYCKSSRIFSETASKFEIISFKFFCKWFLILIIYVKIFINFITSGLNKGIKPLLNKNSSNFLDKSYL